MKLHAEDALVHLKGGTITLTVDGDAVASNIHPGDAAEPKFEDVRQKWDAAVEQKEFDKLSEIATEYWTLVADTSSAIAEYHDKISSAEGNTDNGHRDHVERHHLERGRRQAFREERQGRGPQVPEGHLRSRA